MIRALLGGDLKAQIQEYTLSTGGYYWRGGFDLFADGDSIGAGQNCVSQIEKEGATKTHLTA